MKTPLLNINIQSIYFKDDERLSLPKRMAQCTPDTKQALLDIGKELKQRGGILYLSDLFRSYEMQLQSHMDWKSGRKKAFSPPPGGSMHEAGRAFDLDLDHLEISLADFWEIAKKYGVYPIISKPKAGVSESWHFDCRGSHQKVYEYYSAKKGTNMAPYTAMAASGIMSIGVQVDAFGKNQAAAAVQAGLIRLGYELGNIDGSIGQKTRTALGKAQITWTTVDDVLLNVESLLKKEYPKEYEVSL